MNNRLYKSRDNIVIDGVCGGIAEYFNIDATLIRLGFILLAFPLHISVLLIYIVLGIIVPRREADLNNDFSTTGQEQSQQSYPVSKPQRKYPASLYIGGGLVLLGAYTLLKDHIYWLDMGLVVSVGLVLLGVYMIITSRRTRHD